RRRVAAAQPPGEPRSRVDGDRRRHRGAGRAVGAARLHGGHHVDPRRGVRGREHRRRLRVAAAAHHHAAAAGGVRADQRRHRLQELPQRVRRHRRPHRRRARHRDPQRRDDDLLRLPGWRLRLPDGERDDLLPHRPRAGAAPAPAHARTGGGPMSRRVNVPVTATLLVCTLAVLVPLYVTVTMAFKTGEQAVDGNAFSLPSPATFGALAEAWRLTSFPRAFTVSVLVTLVSVVGTVVLSSAASYAVARNWDRRLFRWSFFYLLGAMFLPFPVLALSQVRLTGLVGLDNPAGVAILHVMFQLSFSTLLYTAFLRSLPAELEESARLDGATTWQVFWRLVFPLLAPMSATVGIFAFLASWNDFMMPSMITAD